MSTTGGENNSAEKPPSKGSGKGSAGRDLKRSRQCPLPPADIVVTKEEPRFLNETRVQEKPWLVRPVGSNIVRRDLRGIDEGPEPGGGDR